MTEAKHTPGPWSNEGKPITVRGLHFLSHAHYESEEGEANSRLIAAAPDLLEALKEAANSSGFQYMMFETRERINDAIAKAEGRS